MFKTIYIYELLKGQLSENGYKHFLNTISFYINKLNWPKNIIVSYDKGNFNIWTPDDIKELAHQFFEWIIIKGKLEYLNKIPENYLSYYFLQILVSFIAEKIKQEQQTVGLSFEKCRELVLDISKSDFINNNINDINYVYNKTINKKNIKHEYDISNAIIYLPKIPLTEKTKHFKPLIKLAIEDIFNTVESPIELKKLVEFVYDLFDQKSFFTSEFDKQSINIEFKESFNEKHNTAILKLLSSVTKEDAILILTYLFKSKGELSLSYLATEHNLPKSTIHHKIKSFKDKIFELYIPENEEDGILFIQNIASALDKISK